MSITNAASNYKRCHIAAASYTIRLNRLNDIFVVPMCLDYCSHDDRHAMWHWSHFAQADLEHVTCCAGDWNRSFCDHLCGHIRVRVGLLSRRLEFLLMWTVAEVEEYRRIGSRMLADFGEESGESRCLVNGFG